MAWMAVDWGIAAALAAGCALIAATAWADKSAFPQGAWEERSPLSVGLDAEKLEAAVAYLQAHSGRDGVRELVIVRNGYLIWYGDNIDHVHGVWSLTNSLAPCSGCSSTRAGPPWTPAPASTSPSWRRSTPT
ncbi:MAG: hypothetical protein AB7Y46_00920 [Armatimonadota bacterium]